MGQSQMSQLRHDSVLISKTIQSTRSKAPPRTVKVTLVIPTLNEIEGMRNIIPRIPKGCCDQILVIDGGSTDGTVEYAKEQGYTVMTQRRKGMRRAYHE